MTLPIGYRVCFEPDVASLDGGRVLVGGSPLGVARLSERARNACITGPDGRLLVDVHDPASAALADRLLARNLARPDPAGLPAPAAADLTVVVPVRDRPEQLDRCLHALTGLACVVVDDASRAPAAVAEVAQAHGAALVALARNRGPAGARNAGLALVATPLVAFVDSDVVVTAPDLTAAARHFADPAVALVGPRILGTCASPAPGWFQRYDSAHSSLDQGAAPATVQQGARVAWLPSACLVARTTTVHGGFDTAMRVGEDVDLVWRVLAAGHRVRYAPEVVATHQVRSTARAWLGRISAYGSSGAALAVRHGSAVAPAAFAPLHGLAGAALLARHPAAVPLLTAAFLISHRAVRRALPSGVPAEVTASRIAALSLVSATTQCSALAVRHWWPLTVLGLRTAPGRRLLASALIVDSWVAWTSHRTLTGAAPHPAEVATVLLCRRLSDLAYGAGLWRGVLTSPDPRALRCLLPRFPRVRRLPRLRRTGGNGESVIAPRRAAPPGTRAGGD